MRTLRTLQYISSYIIVVDQIAITHISKSWHCPTSCISNWRITHSDTACVKFSYIIMIATWRFIKNSSYNNTGWPHLKKRIKRMSTSNFLNLIVTFIVKLYILLYTKYTMYREYSANKVLNGYGKKISNITLVPKVPSWTSTVPYKYIYIVLEVRVPIC